MATNIIKIAKLFSRTPGPRYIHEGSWSGELFRTTHLSKIMEDAITNNIKVIIDLDGGFGYGTSFLEESFGGLIREHKLNYKDILNHLEIVSVEEPYLIDDIYFYLKDASKKTLDN